MRNVKIGLKLLLSYLLIGLIPLLTVGLMTLTESSEELSTQTFQKLESVRQIKKNQIEKFFTERTKDMDVLVDTVSILRHEAMEKLKAVREVKKNAVERYLQTINNQILTFSEDRMVIDAMYAFKRGFRRFRIGNISSQLSIEQKKAALLSYYEGEFSQEYQKQNDGATPDVKQIFAKLDDDSIVLQYSYIKANPHPLGSKHLLKQTEDPSEYNRLHEQIHPIIASYLEKFGYYDIFLVDPDTGDIVYSVFKELDYSTSLIDGPYANTNLAEAFRKANMASNANSVIMVDYAQYPPSYEAPAAFVASPIFDGKQKLGIAIFQFPIDNLNAIMTERAGLGDTGETYLVGADGLMRSDSFLDPDNHSVTASFRKPETGKIDSVAVQAALAGKSGTEIIVDYNGNPVLSAYAPVAIGATSWALMAEIDLAEAFNPVDASGREYYTDYIEKNGYYDLFLINPDGYVFYTATHEADYQTNIVNGKFADSGLGQLTRKVLESKQFGLEDFAPYAPSNNDPAAFIAQPVINAGKTEVVVALQLSLEAINSIMTERTGMGETGETYLIGPDKLMRSDSFLDPQNHTVKASFANPDIGRVDTDAANEALAGKSGSKIIIDYNGNPVLSAFTPIKVGDLTWALLAEIDEAEAFAVIESIQLKLLFAIIIALAAIVGIALLITRNITKPISATMNMIQELEKGNLSLRLNMNHQDEIGQMGKALDGFASNMQDEVVAAFEALANGNLNFEANGVIKRPLADANTSLKDVIGQIQIAGDQIASGSVEVADSSQTLSHGATEQASNLEEISASLTEIAAQTNKNAENANQANQLADNAQQAANKGSSQMQAMVSAMTEINESGQNISKIIQTIDEIAFQTNLLALNAAVEAARAGQHGKGFAVVAEEVRNLAARSAKAAAETAELIKGSAEKTENGSHIANQTAEALARIVSSITQVTDLVGEIATASNEQAQGITQVNLGVSQIDTLTQQNSANAEESAATAEELSAQAEHLRQLSQRFTLTSTSSTHHE